MRGADRCSCCQPCAASQRRYRTRGRRRTGADGLRESLAEAKAGRAERVHTPEQVMARHRGRPAGTLIAVTKEPVKLHLDPAPLAALPATGDDWQTRINDLLRASLSLAGRLR